MISIDRVQPGFLPVSMSVERWGPVFFIVVAFLAVSLMLPLAAGDLPPDENQDPGPALAQVKTPTPAAQKSWVKLPPMPEAASQADYGAELFRLVCSACHGDKGQGLTAAWRSTWGPNSHNCWQSKCHAPNHPPDGFEIPHFIRPIIGQGTLWEFETAADLFMYVRDYQPWHNPGSMTDEEYWQLTAFLLRENGVDMKGEPLELTRATSLLVHPEGRPEIAPTIPEEPAVDWLWLALLIVPGAVILYFGVRWLRR